MSFSEMLACDSDANGCDFVCSHNVCEGRHFYTDTPLFSQSCNSQQINKNQTGRNNSSCEISINPFAAPSSEIIVTSEQQRQPKGTVGGFLFLADKNGMDGFRKADVVSTQRKMFIEQMTVSVDYADRRTHSSSLPLSSLTPHKE
ncbi:uncharacterized protein MONOS_15647 [Monocercomonoides exilis]|uniref:uncharacterized protein n=1 Tax=Monocercomonoides exilis TaxID=2049356 RepID=UPI00355AB7C8|nr:hypothetical protein MONOS_15647 [Monocercomonoides exilis]|eukprot:MONOS_15647.1-p1 / transcript=MONOS_15647.1 / gene=MONOS_15647 / organism=Monocercomonoides_exilis_PA203 / gene_product=unspecified product / transcript_product=unspecified product / location=Mono_scaffold01296:6772-7206(+) / protein_length=145 / sequence_SO=supercontig / SO=protein_coding / is_pseudo=false